MMIRELRILPPFAIGRLGSAKEPLVNYTMQDDPENPLGYRAIVGAPTLIVDPESGAIRECVEPVEVTFKDGDKIRPVAPFLEVYAVTDDDAVVPLTLDLLRQNGFDGSDVSWRARVANRKVFRRTGDAHDIVEAGLDWFSGHQSHALKGECHNFVDGGSIDFGSVRYIRPTAEFPGIRLRFTPAKGRIYGPDESVDGTPDPVIEDPRETTHRRAIYDTKAKKGKWRGFGPGGPSFDDSAFFNDTLPPALYAIVPPAPSWLHHNRAVSRGYLDDACDGFVEVRLPGLPIARARICAGPPAMVPDSLFVRSLQDDFDQIVLGPEVAGDEPEARTRERAIDIVRRAYETVRFMNVAVMNGNDYKGRSALTLDSMPEEEAADTQRPIRPVMSPSTVDTRAILALHEQVYAALKSGAAPWFLRLLRKPEEAADFTDRGRRKMPALMCGADNNYLALTRRQIDTIRKAAEESLFASNTAVGPAEALLTPLNRTAQIRSAQIRHAALGNPVSSRPEAAVANCCPGLEVDFRAVWRRVFKGIVLREWDSLVVEVEKDAPAEVRALEGHRLLYIYLDGKTGEEDRIPVFTRFLGPASSDPDGAVLLSTDMNPAGLAPLEWSNALAHVLKDHQGKTVRCEFTRNEVRDLGDDPDPLKDPLSVEFEVRPFFEGETAVISASLADAGELTQGLCSPWQNDYRECSCYYWASARPDFVNVDPTPGGLSKGDNWLQKKRTGNYVADDYVDTRLIHYDDLFLHWEKLLQVQVRGRDVPRPADKEGGKP